MPELWQFTKLIRSKNAGPFELTFDLMFKDREGYEQVLNSGAISIDSIAQLYRVDPSRVRFFRIDKLCAIKITIPREIFSGDVKDTDIYGVNFTALWCDSTSAEGFGFLLDLLNFLTKCRFLVSSR